MNKIEGSPPPSNNPVILGDYNAVGLSGDEGDNSIYFLHRVTLKNIDPKEGLEVFVYDDDISEAGEPEVFGYVCKLQKSRATITTGAQNQLTPLGIEAPKHGRE